MRIIMYAIWSSVPTIFLRTFIRDLIFFGNVAIDIATPVGCGLRLLVLGDRFKGKTSLLVDLYISVTAATGIFTSLFGHRLLIPGVFVVIGRRRQESLSIFLNMVALGTRFRNNLIIVNAGAHEPAAILWVAPYVGCAICDFCIYAGTDSVLLINDLSKHANAYRLISLLLRRPPAREAFPGDVFYLHARLLERCAVLSSNLGCGSITGIPVVETQEEELSAYIPTNIISITDGLLVLDNLLFNQGIRPAVNLGLSVSRIGSAVLTSGVKTVAGSLRLEIALYRSLARNRLFKDLIELSILLLLERGDLLTLFFLLSRFIPEILCSIVCTLRVLFEDNIATIFLSTLSPRMRILYTSRYKLQTCLGDFIFQKVSGYTTFYCERGLLLLSSLYSTGFSADVLHILSYTMVGVEVWR